MKQQGEDQYSTPKLFFLMNMNNTSDTRPGLGTRLSGAKNPRRGEAEPKLCLSQTLLSWPGVSGLWWLCT